MIVQHVHSREWPLSIRNEYIGRNRIITRKPHLYLTGLITVALFLEEYLIRIVPLFIGCRWGSQHRVEHLLTGHTAPFVEIGDIIMTPC